MRRPALALLALAAACATPRSPSGSAARGAGAPEIRFDPELVEASALDLELRGKNDEELFAIGSAAFSAGDFRRAAGAFARVADLFPASRHAPAALHQAGLAYERLEAWRLALERFRTLERTGGDAEAIEASFRTAECLYHLRELADARAVLDRLAARADLASGDAIRALTQRGIVQLEDGRPEDAERSLRLALSRWQASSQSERLDDYYPAQAQFYLGEVYRSWFLAVQLDPARGEEKLAKDLEYKADLLLSAQGHYLRAIKIGNPEWTVASGYRIGELYDELHRQMVEAPLPPGLDDARAAAYRSELKARVRVLVTKAIATYEATLATAERVRLGDNAFVEKTQASLERMKRLLGDADRGSDAAPAAPAPGRLQESAHPEPVEG